MKKFFCLYKRAIFVIDNNVFDSCYSLKTLFEIVENILYKYLKALFYQFGGILKYWNYFTSDLHEYDVFSSEKVRIASNVHVVTSHDVTDFYIARIKTSDIYICLQ